MLVSHLSYAQYPTTKIIKNDTVVIMTLKQADEINIQFDSYTDSLYQYRKGVASLKSNIDSLYLVVSNLNGKITNLNNELFKLQTENKILIEDRKRDLKSFGIVALFSFFLTSIAWVTR